MTMSSDNNKPKPDLHFETDLCKGCGLCIHMCPRDVLTQSPHLNRLGFRYVEYVGDGCNGCGICFHTCPEPGGIHIERP